MTRQEAQDLKQTLSQSEYIEGRSIKVRRYGSEYTVEFSEGGCGYRFSTLAQAAAAGFYKA